jgi:hypothetical protein
MVLIRASPAQRRNTVFSTAQRWRALCSARVAREDIVMITNNSLLLGVLAGIVAIGACDAGRPAEQTTPSCVGPPTDPHCFLDVSDESFVRGAAPVTDGVSTAVVHHTPGKFCMSGQIDPGPTNENWGALLVLSLAEHTPTGVAAPFNALAHGITQVRMTIDPPPLAGLAVSFSALQRADCLDLPACFTAASFFVEDGGAERIIEDPGTVTFPLTAFVQPSWGDKTLAFDPTLISGLELVAGVLPGPVLDYDFCVRDVNFLDAAGRVVSQ